MAVNWVNQIPIKITALKRREDKYSIKQMGAIVFSCVAVALNFIFCFRGAMHFDRWYTSLLMFLVFLLVCLVILRIFLMIFFDEKALYAKYLKDKESLSFKLSEFWDILFISDNGVMLVRDREVGGQVKVVVVKMERSSTMGRPPESEVEHYRGMTMFIRKILSMGHSIRNYNLSLTDSNDECLDRIENSLTTISNSKLKAGVSKILRYNRDSVRKFQNRTVEFYAITSMSPSADLYSEVKDAMGILVSHTIYKPEICTGRDLIAFFYDVNKIRYIDVKSLVMGNLPKDSIYKIEEVIRTNDYKQAFKVVDVTSGKNVYSMANKLDLEDTQEELEVSYDS